MNSMDEKGTIDVRNIFSSSDSKYDSLVAKNKEVLHCPICNGIYTSFKVPEYTKGLDDYKAWEGRGDLISIPIWCENGHKFDLCLGIHKGVVAIFISNYEEIEYEG